MNHSHCDYCGEELHLIKDWNNQIDGFICINEDYWPGIPCRRYRQPQGFVRHFIVSPGLAQFLAGNEFRRAGDLQPAYKGRREG